MKDRSESKSSNYRLHPFLQTLASSNSVQPHSRVFIQNNNPLVQSIGDRRRQAQRLISTQRSPTRAKNVDRSKQINRNRLVKHTSEDSLNQTETITEIRGQQTIYDGNPHILPRIEISSTRSERKSQTETSTSSSIPIVEYIACEIVMIYMPTESSNSENLDREEITIIQQHSPNDTSLVYRGYLTKEDIFSFKCQRRPTSCLSLAFYIEGTLVNVINDCCEFNYAQKISTKIDKKQFIFKDISKANPCEKCRKDYAEELMINKNKNTLLVQENKKPIQPVLIVQEKKPEEPAKSIKPPVIPSSTTQIGETPTVPATSRSAVDELLTSSNIKKQLSTVNSHTDLLSQTIPGYSKPNKIDFKFPIQLIQSSKMERHAKSIENFCYLIETNLSISNDEQETLHGLINLGFPIDNINSTETIQFLKTIQKERIIYILSKTSMENLVQPIQDEPLLSAIYLIDSSETSCSFDSKFYRGSFPNLTQLCQQLKLDLQSMTYTLTKTACIPPTYNRMSTFNYAQALIDILVETDTKTDLKKDMLEFCREEYVDNKIQLKFIDQFENDFQPEQAIDWYLREESFIYKMLTRAFRRLDADILYQCRYFIQHLYSQMKSYVQSTELTVYHTLRIRKDEFEKIERYQDGFLSFNEFLLVDKNLATNDLFPMNTDSKVVQFQMKLGNKISRYEIANQSNKVLLTMGTIFHINTIEQIDNHTYKVQLNADEEIFKTAQTLTNDLRVAIRSPYPLVRMVQLMKQRDSSGYIEYFSLLLIKDPEAMKDRTVNLILGGLFHSLGTNYYEKKYYDQALKHLQNALSVYKQCLNENDVKLSPTYNNIGSIYHKQGLNEQALEYHKKAFEIQRNSTNPDLNSIVAYAGNIASVLIKLGRHQEALAYLIIDLQIKQKLHPNNDSADLSSRYFNVAGVYHRLQEYVKALQHYEKCLEIELNYVSKDNPTVAVTYYSMAATLEKLDRFEEARDAVKKAIERLLLTKSEDDEEVQTQRRYLQKLENKIIMQNVFGAKN